MLLPRDVGKNAIVKISICGIMHEAPRNGNTERQLLINGKGAANA
jgi:hypothetical protein